MAKEPKSPQQKKELEYTKDHFTFGWKSSRTFPIGWRRKKARVNRQYRRKSDQVLLKIKGGAGADDVETIGDDLTAGRFQKSVSRKRLHKVGTVTLREKVQRTLEKRKEAEGRNVRRNDKFDRAAIAAVKTLESLEGGGLYEAALRASKLCQPTPPSGELVRAMQSRDSLDRALYFLRMVFAGSSCEVDALRRNPAVDRALGKWLQKAERVLAKHNYAVAAEKEQRKSARSNLKNLRAR